MCAGASLSFLSDTRARETRWAISSSIGVILENSAKDRDPGWFCLIYDCLVVRGAVRVDSCSLTVLFAHEKLIQVCATWSYIMDAANMAPPWWDAPCPLLHSIINSLARFCCCWLIFLKKKMSNYENLTCGYYEFETALFLSSKCIHPVWMRVC